MRKYILIGLALLTVFAGWQIASPWMAMDTLRDAAREGDCETLEDSIDFPALRESVKGELYQRIDIERGDGGAGERDGGFAKVFADSIVDALVTPKGVGAMLVTGSLIPRTRGPDADEEVDWHVRMTAFDTFRADPVVSDGQARPSLIFKRSGLGWKLAGIDVPDA